MSRFKVLRANPRRTLAALATLLIAVGVTAASGANFTATSANPSNTFSSGTMTHAQHERGRRDPHRHEHEARRHRPAGEVNIKNTGTLPGAFTLSQGQPSTDIDARRCRRSSTSNIVDCGADQDCATTGDDVSIVHDGTLAADGHRRHARRRRSARSPPARSTSYKFTVTLDVARRATPSRARPPAVQLRLGRRVLGPDGSDSTRLI